MLERITIVNFQPYEKFTIDLDPAVTFFVGPTDSGKSSILRALRWVALNQPSGEEFIRNGADFTSVRLLTDGIAVTRRKGDGKNIYKLGDQVLKSFGTGKVPEPVRQLLQMDAINFQQQLDAPFWFSLTAGQVSKELNHIVNLEIIDTTLAAVASEVKRAKMKEEIASERLAAVKKEWKELRWLDDCETALAEVEQQEQEFLDSKHTWEELRILVKQMRGLKQQKRQLLQAKEEGRKVVLLAEEVYALGVRISKLATLLDELREYRELRKRKVPDLSAFTKMYEYGAILFAKTKDLEYIVTQTKEAELCQQKASAAAKKAAIDLRERTGGICPVCGKPMAS